MFIFANSPLLAWEPVIAIGVDAGHEYEKPEIAFGPSGTVYISYRQKTKTGGNSDIYLCTYDGKELVYENVSELADKWASHKAYEAAVAVDPSEGIHITWIAHDRNDTHTHYIMYRYKEGNTWSEVFELAPVVMHKSHDVCFDTRIAADSSGNAHVVTFKEEEKNVWYVAKYGDTITPLTQVGNVGAWSKHPDITVDDNYVHVMWQQKLGFPYVQLYQKWENRIGGLKSDIQQLTTPKEPYASQKGRLRVDPNGLIHMLDFYKTGVVKNLYYYEQRPDGSWIPEVNVSNPTKMQLYHWAGLSVRENSIIATMQLGSTSGGNGLFYNWKRNGQWQGYQLIPGTGGAVHQSTDLSWDGEVAAIAFGKNLTQVYLVSSAPIVASGQLEVQFTSPATVFAGSDVTFDATEVVNLNPDYNIVQYDWDFGDGTTAVTNAPAVMHNFDIYGRTVTVTLKVTAETGEEGEGSLDVQLHALYGGIITSVTEKRIRTLFFNRGANDITWQANPKNAAAGYPSIVGYEIWRVPVSSSMAASEYVRVGSVSAGVNTFLDMFSINELGNYVYAIRSVDSEGHMSPVHNL
jgi:hypothetical protein